MNNIVTELQRLIELEAQDSNRRREREATLPLISAVIEALPVALLVIDAGGRIILVNEATEFMFTYHRSDLIGQAVEALMPEYQSAVTVINRKKHANFELSSHAQAIRLGEQLKSLRSDGREFLTEIMLARVVVKKGACHLALVRYPSRTMMRPQFGSNAEASGVVSTIGEK